MLIVYHYGSLAEKTMMRRLSDLNFWLSAPEMRPLTTKDAGHSMFTLSSVKEQP